MSDKYEQFLQEARESGEIPESWLDRIASTYEASGLRTDLKETREKYRLAMEQNEALRMGVLRDRFKSLGITISPKALNIPSDLDPTDEEKISAWAQEMELIPKVETTTPEVRSTHDRIAAASNEGSGTSIPSLSDLDPSTLTEDQFYKLAAQREAALKAQL